MKDNLYQQQAEFALAAPGKGDLLARQIRWIYARLPDRTVCAWMVIAMLVAACEGTTTEQASQPAAPGAPATSAVLALLILLLALNAAAVLLRNRYSRQY